MEESAKMNEPPAQLKEWETPELIVEDIKSATRGGGTAPPLDGAEEAVDGFYHS
jgi:hypothetical protein